MTVEEGPGFDLGLVSGNQLFLVITVLAFIAASWVYWDAKRRDVPSPGIWAAAIAFLFLFYVIPGIAALVVYAVMRGEVTQDSDRRP